MWYNQSSEVKDILRKLLIGKSYIKDRRHWSVPSCLWDNRLLVYLYQSRVRRTQCEVVDDYESFVLYSICWYYIFMCYMLWCWLCILLYSDLIMSWEWWLTFVSFLVTSYSLRVLVDNMMTTYKAITNEKETK